MYWTFTQTTMLMPTCSRQTLVKDHAFLVKPAYYLKSLYGVRGFCVCDISVMQEICTIKWILSLCKQNPTKPYRLRIWGKEGYTKEQIAKLMFINGRHRKTSDYSLYWRAGNSIVVQVLSAVFTAIIKQYPDSFGEFACMSPKEWKTATKKEYQRRYYASHKEELQRKSCEYHRQLRVNKNKWLWKMFAKFST